MARFASRRTRPFSSTRGSRGRLRLQPARHPLCGGEALGVLLQPLDAEQLRADRLLDRVAKIDPPGEWLMGD